jgi:hypothetical protein
VRLNVLSGAEEGSSHMRKSNLLGDKELLGFRKILFALFTVLSEPTLSVSGNL